MKIAFTKAQASGNDFIIIDTFSMKKMISDDALSRLAKTMCERKWSVGADGVLVIERSKHADFRLRIFNPDGSEASMCGNGSRCAALYAARKKRAPLSMRIATGAGMIEAGVRSGVVKVRLTEPKDIKWNFCLTIHTCPYMVSFANTGVPHVVHLVKDVDTVDVKAVGSSMRHHKDFSPEGTNADFVQVIGRSTIKVRTYERGVEDETYACGTGVVAGAIIAAESERLSSPVTVQTKGGERLKVYFKKREGTFSDIFLEGKARLVFEGTFTCQGA